MVLGSILRCGFKMLSRRRLPIIDGKLQVKGLLKPVEIIRDKWGVPHIYAENVHDLFFAQGFVHAQDRLWQMELNRRTAKGTLSEIFGEIALETDRISRTFGFGRLGITNWENIDDNSELKEVIQAYTNGINSFLKNTNSKLPIEFTLIRYKPELWKPEDVVAFGRLMLWQLSHTSYNKLIRAKISNKIGVDKAAEIEINYPEKNPIILPKGIEFNILSKGGNLLKSKGPFIDRGKGSNAWAISGWKTKSKNAILCNDMHLQLSLPAIWYENHLNGGGYNVTGVTAPGLPFVHVGHNDTISWGMTLALTDCEDLFIEKINPENPHQYRYKGEWLNTEVITENIIVKGKVNPHIEKVILTKHGPIISEVIDSSQMTLAIQSMALRNSTQAFNGWMSLNKAKSWNDFIKAVKFLDIPPLNIAYADTEGNIGNYVSGRVPLRSKPITRTPVPGWSGEYDWIGEVPFEEMPHILNPEVGFFVTCNNKIISDDYSYDLGSNWMNGYRARRFTEIIEKKEQISIDDCINMQNDFYCIPGYELKEHFNNIEFFEPDIQIALGKLLSWDCFLTPDSIGGAIYEVTRYFLVRNILKPCLGDELINMFMGEGFHPILYATHEFYGHDTLVILRLLTNPDSWWIKQAGGREEVLKRSLQDGVHWLKETVGKNINNWQWGKIHRVTFSHAMGLKKPLDKVFNRGPLPIGGDTDTLCQTAILPNDPFDLKAWGPSHRQIIDMGDFSNSLMVFGPGQSGQLASLHYDDLVNSWLNGNYHPLLWRKDEIEEHAEGRLYLTP